MSSPISKIICTGCSYKAINSHASITLQYILPDGSIFKTGRVSGWCYSCDKLADIEPLDKDNLEMEILYCRDLMKRYEAQSLVLPSRLQYFFCAFFNRKKMHEMYEHEQNVNYGLACTPHRIEKLEETLKIAKMRNSKARCFSCWSQNTASVLFDSDDEVAYNFVHKCGGHLKIDPEFEEIRFTIRPSVINLDIEGNLIEQV